jgi:dinuclear metal center YbgI/SA1388 family protein
MAFVEDILEALERVAPARYAFDWDKMVERAVVSLDRSMGAIHFAMEQDAQFLLTHHPLIFSPLSSVTTDTYEGRAIQRLLYYGIAHAAAHTNWDAAGGGINDALVELLQLRNVKPFGMSSGADSFRLTVYVPSEALNAVLDACAAAGAGVIGNYRRCAFYSTGAGTFEASSEANPHLGNPGERTTVEEERLEMFCPSQLTSGVVKAMKAAHPYEEPAFDLIPLSKGQGQQLGRIGELAEAVSLSDFSASVDAALGTRSMTWGWADKPITRVAVEGGAADSDWQAAKAAGASVLVTGEVKQHIALEAAESNFAIIAAGHYATEHPGCESLRLRMAQEVPDVEWFLFEPQPGMSGRPL